jgi:hypothetical protein
VQAAVAVAGNCRSAHLVLYYGPVGNLDTALTRGILSQSNNSIFGTVQSVFSPGTPIG